MSRLSDLVHVCAAVALSVTLGPGCATRGPLATEISGTPSRTGCDAWFASQGTYSQRNDVRFTLQNRSANTRCVARSVQYWFVSAIVPERFRVSGPPGWSVRAMACPRSKGSCGFEWQSDGAGVSAGQQLGGFRMSYLSVEAPNARSWIIDLGRRRVEMPVGNVAGNE